jgi:hypothetical protein
MLMEGSGFLHFCDFVLINLLSLKTDENVPTASDEQKIRLKMSRTRNTARRAILVAYGLIVGRGICNDNRMK